MNTSTGIRARVIRPERLTSRQIDEMCDLYLAHHHTDRAACQQRITTGFDRIGLFTCRATGRVVGFNGMRIGTFRVQGFIRPIRSLYLGQMFVEASFRGQHPIHRVCSAALLPVLLQPWYRCIVWGDALTYKPFLLIAHNASTFFPNPDQDTPARYQTLIDHLGHSHYGDRYSPATGCVSKDRKLVKDHVAPIDPRLLRSRLIRFYAEKNQGYQQGDGLLVMMDFTWSVFLKILTKLSHPALKHISLPKSVGVAVRRVFAPHQS